MNTKTSVNIDYRKALDRVRSWEQSASRRLREQILVPHFSGNGCCLHNWMLNFESGIPTITPEVYDLGRYYNWKQDQIWKVARRLTNHFAWKAFYPERKTSPYANAL